MQLDLLDLDENHQIPPPPLSSPPPPPFLPRAKPNFIIVPQRIINIVDIKFDEDPYNVTLYGILSADEYKREIRDVNNALQSCRSTFLDHALMFSGPALLPLIPWAIRSKQRKKERRETMEGCIDEFNRRHPDLTMRWQVSAI